MVLGVVPMHDLQTPVHVLDQGAAAFDPIAVIAIQNAIDHAHQLQHISIEKGKKIAHDTDTYVHEHPWRAIGMSAALGVLIGMLIARR